MGCHRDGCHEHQPGSWHENASHQYSWARAGVRRPEGPRAAPAGWHGRVRTELVLRHGPGGGSTLRYASTSAGVRRPATSACTRFTLASDTAGVLPLLRAHLRNQCRWLRRLEATPRWSSTCAAVCGCLDLSLATGAASVGFPVAVHAIRECSAQLPCEPRPPRPGRRRRAAAPSPPPRLDSTRGLAGPPEDVRANGTGCAGEGVESPSRSRTSSSSVGRDVAFKSASVSHADAPVRVCRTGQARRGSASLRTSESEGSLMLAALYRFPSKWLSRRLLTYQEL